MALLWGLATAFTVDMAGVFEMETGAFVFDFFHDIRLRLWSLLSWGGECIFYGIWGGFLSFLSVFAWRCGRAAYGFREGSMDGAALLSGVGDVFIVVPTIFTW